ncbi:hypothetical protein C8R44DRAFT_621964 [Mycena epipterygia]|nr:hypothetical protein C8R44DRAFT_621964 [Mycena epipterygia]
MFARQCTRRAFSSLSKRVVETDSCGIPLRATWSVNQLLSSYPTPSIAPHTFKRLHELSALLPPEEDTAEYHELKAGLEELIRLVEAVKIVDTERITAFGSEDPSIQVVDTSPPPELPHNGRSLLQHAARTRNGFYIVDADKPQ